MKKIGTVAFGLALVALGFGLFIMRGTGNEAENKNTPATMRAEKAMIALYRESGDVFYTNPNTSETQLTADLKTVEVFSGTQIRTTNGLAYILFPDNSMMSVDSKTSLTLEYSKEKVTIFQTLGNTYHRVKTLENGQEYEVRTPGTLAAVRGTKFAVLLDFVSKKTNVKVIESNVRVQKLDSSKPVTEKPVVLQEIIVPTGSQIDVREDVRFANETQLSARVINAQEIKDSGWMEKNEVIDQATNSPEMRKKFIEEVLSNSKENATNSNREKIKKLRETVKKFIQENPDANKEAVRTEVKEVFQKELLTNPIVPIKVLEPIKLVPPVTPISPTVEGERDYNDPFVLEFDKAYEIWFPLYKDKATFCVAVSNLTPERIRSTLTTIETNFKQLIPNKDKVLSFLPIAKTHCTSNATDNTVLEEQYTEKYPF